MEITDRLLTKNIYSRPGTMMTAVGGIIIHYVGNAGSTAIANRNYFESLKNGSGTYASSHYIIGLEGEIIRCVPDGEVAYHSGKSYGDPWDDMAKSNNKTMLSIETCHPGADGRFNDRTYAALVELTAHLCKEYGLTTENIYRHYDRTGKSCPLYYVRNGDAWDVLLADIAGALYGLGRGKEDEEVIETITVMVNGKEVQVDRILKEDRNYIKINDLNGVGDIAVSYESGRKMPIITTK